MNFLQMKKKRATKHEEEMRGKAEHDDEKKRGPKTARKRSSKNIHQFKASDKRMLRFRVTVT